MSAMSAKFVGNVGELRPRSGRVLIPSMPWDIWLIFLILGVLIPWRGRTRLRELLAKPVVTGRERVLLYGSTIAFQWIAVGVVWWRSWAHGYSARQLALSLPMSTGHLIAVSLLPAGLIAGLQWLNLRRVSRLPLAVRGQSQKLAERILPQSRTELMLFQCLAVTAGVCEEFLYRGFTFAALAHAGLPTWMIVVLSAALFGLAHSYQGRGGVVATAVLGLVLGSARSFYGSLIPVMAWHAAVDIVAGIAGPRYLISNHKDTESLLKAPAAGAASQ